MTKRRKPRPPFGGGPKTGPPSGSWADEPHDGENEAPDGAGTDTVAGMPAAQTPAGGIPSVGDGAERTRPAFPPSARPGVTGGGGDTLRMKSVVLAEGSGLGGDAPGRPSRPKPRPRPAERVRELPRRDYAARHRFGFIWFILGFFGLIFRVILITVVVGGISAFLGYQAVRVYIRTPETTVPNVKGMKVSQALDQLAKARLGIEQERTEASGLVAPGEIIGQRPLPGSRTKEGSMVRVIVSSGMAAYVVPDVVNETQENAISKIKSARMEVGNVTPYPNDKVPKGVVISQDPEAGKGYESPRKVDMLVSTGP